MDLLGTPLYSFAKRLTTEVLTLGRAGTLIEWNDEEERAFLALYQAEQIINWRMERIGGRNELALVVLRETTEDGYVVCQGVLGKSCFENFEKEKGCRLGRSLSFPFC